MESTANCVPGHIENAEDRDGRAREQQSILVALRARDHRRQLDALEIRWPVGPSARRAEIQQRA